MEFLLLLLFFSTVAVISYYLDCFCPFFSFLRVFLCLRFLQLTYSMAEDGIYTPST